MTTYPANPLIDDARAEQRTVAEMAAVVGRPPTLFARGNLPAYTLSGIDPAQLLTVPWQARHAIATTQSRAEAQRLLDEYAEDEDGMGASYDFADHPANEQYEQRVAEWLEAGSALGDPADWARVDQLLDDGMSVNQVMQAAGVTEALVRAVKRTRDAKATPPPKTRQPWETGW